MKDTQASDCRVGDLVELTHEYGLTCHLLKGDVMICLGGSHEHGRKMKFLSRVGIVCFWYSRVRVLGTDTHAIERKDTP